MLGSQEISQNSYDQRVYYREKELAPCLKELSRKGNLYGRRQGYGDLPSMVTMVKHHFLLHLWKQRAKAMISRPHNNNPANQPLEDKPSQESGFSTPEKKNSKEIWENLEGKEWWYINSKHYFHAWNFQIINTKREKVSRMSNHTGSVFFYSERVVMHVDSSVH